MTGRQFARTCPNGQRQPTIDAGRMWWPGQQREAPRRAQKIKVLEPDGAGQSHRREGLAVAGSCLSLCPRILAGSRSDAGGGQVRTAFLGFL